MVENHEVKLILTKGEITRAKPSGPEVRSIGLKDRLQ